ncbi:MAG: type I-U CRISPR-associated helicase/endonuclease Cas3 [Gemmatales bacterium]
MLDFATTFEALTGNPPFPWQCALYDEWFSKGKIPQSCNLPTGLGKTSVIAIWLIALANHPDKMPRRLVYVVNRRTVVDQTTDEVEKYKKRKVAGISDFAVSTLRGQFADNRAWSDDPSCPAIISGTVDMIGSRLLFSGYGIGRSKKPLHAGFLGQDVLLVHDEAHLEPAFQKLITKIQEEQACEPSVQWPKFRVMELTATRRGTGEVFELTDADKANAVVVQRTNARKKLHFEPVNDEKKPLWDKLFDLAKSFANKKCAVIVFTRTVEGVNYIADKLPKDRVVTLTGTMRGKERDELVSKDIFKRFLPGAGHDGETTWLVCTSAGEVGVNISADHLVCDLSTFESMAQRFGRVNRFGERTDTEIHVVHPTEFKKDDPYDTARKKTLELLKQLDGDASPSALAKLNSEDRQAAFAPSPTILPTTDILFDAWALTTIKGKLPGRPPVEPYLHGLPTEWQPPETQVAWREEVEEITGDLLEQYPPSELLELYTLKPHELLKEPNYRAADQFKKLAKRLGDRAAQTKAWLMDDDGTVAIVTLEDLVDKDLVAWKTVILPPSVGGLSSAGMLDGTSETADDVSETSERKRLWNAEEAPEGMHRIESIVFASGEDEDADPETWDWFVHRNEGDRSSTLPVLWQVHVDDVVRSVGRIVANLTLDDSLKQAIVTAAKFHDHGKRRKLFQTVLGNRNYSDVMLAKSGAKGTRVVEKYRHEFGSLINVLEENLGEHRELILHLIATHHGRARPHFPMDEAFDPDCSQKQADEIAAVVPQRFARLQRKYGRWGLAYLESLLRAADWAASANPSAYLKEGER